ncbi:MAG: glycosyltransferase [Planctomycetia bacterium]|nr:glycosyltransferase [Planctomycetia bacterium]
MTFALSYVVNTYNKLPYLREAMPRLLANVQPDEEVVVIDGASTDGTVAYLTELYEARKIHRLVSESDKGEAHGWNKGILLARGDLIKLVSDDDLFYYPGVRRCRSFMLENDEVDVIANEGADSPWIGDKQTSAYFRDYDCYLSEGRPFAFCGLGIMLRRTSLAVTGLFDPAWKRMDHEFSLRLTDGLANLAWYTGYAWVRISNPRSGTTRNAKRMSEELPRLEQHYFGNRAAPRLMSTPRRMLTRMRRIFAKRRDEEDPKACFSFPGDVKPAFAWCEKWLEEVNQSEPGTFLLRQRPHAKSPQSQPLAIRA